MRTAAILATGLVALSGCASESEPAAAPATVTSTPTTERGSYVTDKTGGRDPEELREFHPDGTVLPSPVLDELATSLCRALATGMPTPEVVDTLVGTGTMGLADAQVFTVAATLEYCPDLA